MRHVRLVLQEQTCKTLCRAQTGDFGPGTTQVTTLLFQLLDV